MDINSVITVGHIRNLALIRWASELLDGLEPTACSDSPRVASPVFSMERWGREVYPGGGAAGYLGGWYTGYYPAAGFEAYLMNIKVNSSQTAV